MTTTAIGVDFGTTNSSIARANESGGVDLAQFPTAGAMTDAYRSLLYLEQQKERGVNALKSWTGPEGIERYLAAETKGRLIQSLSERNLRFSVCASRFQPGMPNVLSGRRNASRLHIFADEIHDVIHRGAGIENS